MEYTRGCWIPVNCYIKENHLLTAAKEILVFIGSTVITTLTYITAVKDYHIKQYYNILC